MPYRVKCGVKVSVVAANLSRACTYTQKKKAVVFQECTILPCFVYTEYYPVVFLKQCCLMETAQL